MEADWEFEVGGKFPVIEACWTGYVDLRSTPERARDLPEAAALPGLASALERLNAKGSPVWTSKCDFWPALEPEEFDVDELDAPIGCSTHAMCCYIDLLPRKDRQWALAPDTEAVCKRICSRLRGVELRCCRVDLIVRRAIIDPGSVDMGITAYITACGATPCTARDALELALTAFARAVCPQSTLQ